MFYVVCPLQIIEESRIGGSRKKARWIQYYAVYNIINRALLLDMGRQRLQQVV